MLMFAVSPFCFKVSALVFVPLAHFRPPEYEFRTLSGFAVKMYQICCFVLIARIRSILSGRSDLFSSKANIHQFITRVSFRIGKSGSCRQPDFNAACYERIHKAISNHEDDICDDDAKHGCFSFFIKILNSHCIYARI